MTSDTYRVPMMSKKTEATYKWPEDKKPQLTQKQLNKQAIRRWWHKNYYGCQVNCKRKDYDDR